MLIIAGMTEAMRNDYQFQCSLKSETSPDPAKRIASLKNLIQEFGKKERIKKQMETWGIVINPELNKVWGRQLPPEDILYRGANSVSYFILNILDV